MTNPTACREAFEKWYSDLMHNPLARAYNNPLGMPAKGDMHRAMEMGFQAAWNTRAPDGEAVAWRVDYGDGMPSYLSEKPSMSMFNAIGVNVIPLYTHPRATSAEVERDAERYRWLKAEGCDGMTVRHRMLVMESTPPEALDATIDAALSKP